MHVRFLNRSDGRERLREPAQHLSVHHYLRECRERERERRRRPSGETLTVARGSSRPARELHTNDMNVDSLIQSSFIEKPCKRELLNWKRPVGESIIHHLEFIALAVIN